MIGAVATTPGPAADVVRITDLAEPPPPGPGEVRVRLAASTVNPSDLVTVSGAYGSRTAFPFVPGFEGVGVVTAAGPGVRGEMVGRRVLPIGSAGNWQQARNLSADWCVAVPDDIADRDACFAYINPLTAVAMVDRHITAGTRAVVVDAAGSTIAGHLAELLRLRGIAPVGLVRGSGTGAVADPSRWAAVLNAEDPDAPARLREALGGPTADVVFDCVGGPGGAHLTEVLRPGGVLVHYGLLSGVPLPAACFSGDRGTRVEMFRLRDLVHSGRTPLADLFRPVFGHLRQGRLRTRLGGRHRLGDLEAVLGSPGRGGAKPLITFP